MSVRVYIEPDEFFSRGDIGGRCCHCNFIDCHTCTFHWWYNCSSLVRHKFIREHVYFKTKICLIGWIFITKWWNCSRCSRQIYWMGSMGGGKESARQKLCVFFLSTGSVKLFLILSIQPFSNFRKCHHWFTGLRIDLPEKMSNVSVVLCNIFKCFSCSSATFI